jgi:hypothetical protein
MEGYEPITSFGEATAEVYDEHSKGSDPVATVAFLERFATGGPALELAIGTGRIAVPLAARVRLYPVVCRYAWPCELDLMARLAGLRLKDRWGGWNQEPFTSSSRSHVSVYGR